MSSHPPSVPAAREAGEGHGSFGGNSNNNTNNDGTLSLSSSLFPSSSDSTSGNRRSRRQQEEEGNGGRARNNNDDDFAEMVSNITATLPRTDDDDEEGDSPNTNNNVSGIGVGGEATEDRSVSSFPSYSSLAGAENPPRNDDGDDHDDEPSPLGSSNSSNEPSPLGSNNSNEPSPLGSNNSNETISAEEEEAQPMDCGDDKSKEGAVTAEGETGKSQQSSSNNGGGGAIENPSHSSTTISMNVAADIGGRIGDQAAQDDRDGGLAATALADDASDAMDEEATSGNESTNNTKGDRGTSVATEHDRKMMEEVPPTAPASITEWMRRLYSAGKQKSRRERQEEGGRAEDTIGENATDDLTEMMHTMLHIEEQETRLPADVEYLAMGAHASESGQLFAKSVNRTWAKELRELPSNERDKINEELHCVFSAPEDSKADSTEETPELVVKALQEMDKEINSNTISIQDKKAHLRAIEIHDKHRPDHHSSHAPINTEETCYVRTGYFRLRYLRAERFDPKKAAIRYCHSLNVLHDYFGDNSLTRQLYLSDLTGEEVKFLKDGLIQLMQSTDPAGRRIYFYAPANSTPYSLARARRRIVVFLLYSVLPEDVTAQKRGMVQVLVPSDMISNFDYYYSSFSGLGFSRPIDGRNDDEKNVPISQIIKAIQEMITGLPVNISAFHFCMPNDEPKYKFLAAFYMVLFGKEMRSRSRIHSGSSIIELMYSLQNYGVHDLPLTPTGTIKHKNMKDFVKARAAIDKFRQEQIQQKLTGTAPTTTFTTDDPPGVECPEINCVIFGLSKKFKHHKGNLAFRNMVRNMILLDEMKKANEASADTTETTTDQPKSSSAKLPPRTQNLIFIDKVIKETTKKFIFRTYDASNCWYKRIVDISELRPQISNAIRDTRKRITQEKSRQTGNNTEEKRRRISSKAMSDDDNRSEYNHQDASSRMGLDPRRLKRYKKDDGCFGGNR